MYWRRYGFPKRINGRITTRFFAFVGVAELAFELGNGNVIPAVEPAQE
jgi:hypothetical protein